MKRGQTTRLRSCVALALMFWSVAAPWAAAQPDDPRVREHVKGGLPSHDALHVRNGYVLAYDAQRRVASWVAYHLVPDYLKTPKREGRFATFRVDPDVPHPVQWVDYKDQAYDRGHLAPYKAMGGDRDGDGHYAAQDPDDALTILQANYLSNIVPQHPRLNRSPGLWFQLERFVQDTLVGRRGQHVWIFAGPIFGPGEQERIGIHQDIDVPLWFFELVIMESATEPAPKVLAFLLPHQRVSYGRLENFLVSVDVIEALTGLDFLSELDDQIEAPVEQANTWPVWQALAHP